MAEGRDEDVVPGERVDEQLALGRGDLAAVEGERDHRLHSHRSASISSGQCRKTLRTGIGEAWPRPQIEVCAIASSHSSTFSRVIAARPCSSSSATWWSARLPIRHGVHFWHDSSAKNRIVSASRRSTG